MGAIADLIRAGVDPELVERVHLEICEARHVTVVRDMRADAAERQRRHRENKAKAQAEMEASCHTSSHVTGVTTVPEKEAPQTPKEKTTPLSSETSSPRLPRKTARTKSEIAEDAQPTDADSATATEAGMDRPAFRQQWAKFRDHHRARGNRMKDWAAAWRTWVRNWQDGMGRPLARAGPAERSPPKRNPYRTAGLPAHEQASEPSDFSTPSAYRATVEDRVCALDDSADAGRREPLGDFLSGGAYGGSAWGSGRPC